MLKWKSLLGLSALGLGAGGAYYEYRNNNSFRSVCNLVYAGANMAYIYKFTNGSSEDKNTKASTYLRDALRKNGGIYLKLGQLIATLDVIVPD
jgi:predicted unusual protein kinase regulating ubiquinone biosynthesis (AarF/ABC1/UbiB family)